MALPDRILKEKISVHWLLTCPPFLTNWKGPVLLDLLRELKQYNPSSSALVSKNSKSSSIRRLSHVRLSHFYTYKNILMLEMQKRAQAIRNLKQEFCITTPELNFLIYIQCVRNGVPHTWAALPLVTPPLIVTPWWDAPDPYLDLLPFLYLSLCTLEFGAGLLFEFCDCLTICLFWFALFCSGHLCSCFVLVIPV